MAVKKKGRRVRHIYGKGVVRTAVSVPKKVKKAMDKFQARRHVNWSAIASRAFKNYIKKFEHETKNQYEEV